MLQKVSSDLVISLSQDNLFFFATSYDIGKNVNNLFIVEVHLSYQARSQVLFF